MNLLESAAPEPSQAGVAPPQRCQYHTPSGRRCRQLAKHPDPFCALHAAKEKQRQTADFVARLVGDPENAFVTATGINHSLAELFKLVAADEIAPRRAAVLAYISNLLIHTLREMDKEISEEEANEHHGLPRFLWNIPRPKAVEEDPTATATAAPLEVRPSEATPANGPHASPGTDHPPGPNDPSRKR
jgi:hypothetical protein